MATRETFKQGLRWQIGDDKSVSFLLDNWVSQKTLLPFTQDSSIDRSLRVSDFITANNAWDFEKLSTYLPYSIVVSICAIHYQNILPQFD